MPSGPAAVLLASIAVLGLGAQPASAAGPPLLGDSWSSAVLSSSARLHAEIDPNGLPTTYHFAYIPTTTYNANLTAGKDGFTGAFRSPSGADAEVGSGSGFVVVSRQLSGLQPATAYRYRVVAKNSAPATVTGPALAFTTHPLPSGPLLPDGRGWELVSPIDKNGGQVAAPGTLAGGGLLQAAAQGSTVTYTSSTSFANGPGAPFASQYIATRSAGGWTTQNISAPLFAGSYDTESGGVPYRLFSADLARGLLLSGRHCRGEGSGCPVANPPLPGTDAPAGYQNYYLRETATGGFEALLGAADIAGLGLDPAEFALSLAGASPDLKAVVLSSCAALAPGASDGCGTDSENLYLFSAGALSLVNEAPGAELAAPAGAVSPGGARIYWRDLTSGDLYLREAGTSRQVDTDAGGGGSFEAASVDGSAAFYTKAGHLWHYNALTDQSADLTPGGGVAGVLGTSADASAVYYQDAGGLKLWRAGETTTIAPGASAADPGNWPPATGTARVSADGEKLLFLSTKPLTGYDNTGLASGKPETQVHLYNAEAEALACLSCNPTNARPLGPSSVPGATLNGAGPTATVPYKPRALSASGRRVFFDSDDALALTDTNSDTDAYQWQAQGTGSCELPGGCLALLSSGRATGGARFADASAEGADAFFLTDESLVGSDPGGIDLYDARVGGGFPELQAQIPCNGDACQVLPADPGDPTLTTLLAGLGNPPVRYRKYGQRARCPKGKRRQGGRCVRKARRPAAGNRGGRR